MANLTITDANVAIASSDVRTQIGTAGESLTRMMPVYLDAATSTWKKARATSATLAECIGVTLTPASTSGSVLIATAGTVIVGATVVKGTSYVVSATAGLIAPQADLVATNLLTFIGYATTTANLLLTINATGIVLA